MIDLRSSVGHAAGETALPLTSLLLAALLASGCAPSEHYVRPADPPQSGYIQTPAQVEGTIGGLAGQAVPQVSLGEEPPDAWWTMLDSDQVNRLVLLALKNNQSLAGAKAHLAAARLGSSLRR